MAIEDIALKRSILFSTRMRFSPSTQPIKDTAVGKIVEQILLLADEKGLTVQQIQQEGRVGIAGAAPTFNRLDLERALGDLSASNRIIVSQDAGQERYALSASARQELWDLQRSAERRYARVVERLFTNADEEPSSYATPFLDCLRLCT
jgi:hypothetical protein